MSLAAWSRISSAGCKLVQTRDKTQLKARSTTMARRPGRLMSVIVMDLIVFLMAALAYSQHAKPYCLQQPHSLPSESSVLKAYPCEGGPAKRALYIVRNIFGVYHDMLRLGPSDCWASFQLIIVALTLAAQLTLSRKRFWLLFTSFFSQVHRSIPLVYLLVASYHGISPSSVGKWYLITHPALDLFTNLVFPANPISECVYGVASMMLVTAIWSRFAYLAAGTGAGAYVLAAGAAVSQGADSYAVGQYGFPAQQADGTGIMMSCEAAAAAGSNTNVATSVSLVPSASAESMSPYYLGTWLPFQLLLSLACTIATMMLERWRGPPKELVGVWGNNPLVRLLWTGQLTSQEEHAGCGSAGTADDGGPAARDDDSGPAGTVSCGNGSVDGGARGGRMTSIAREVRPTDRGCDGKSVGMGKLEGYHDCIGDVELTGTAGCQAKEMHDWQLQVSHNNGEEVPALLRGAAASPPPIKPLDNVFMVAEVANGDRERCDGGHDEEFSNPDNIVTGDTVIGNAAAVVIADSAPHGSVFPVEIAESMEAAETQAQVVSEAQALRWCAGFPVHIASGSSSGVGSSLCRDSEVLAEGYMMGVIDMVDAEGEEVNTVELPSDASSRVDVARLDQQGRSETVEPPQSWTQPSAITESELGPRGFMDGLPVTTASAGAVNNFSTTVSPSSIVSEPVPAVRYGIESLSGVGHSNAAIQRRNRGDDYGPDRDHYRAHRLLRSISSQVPPHTEQQLHPQGQGPQQVVGPATVNRILSFEQQQRQRQLLHSRHPVQPMAVQQQQQAQSQGQGQGRWAVSTPQGAVSPAAMMAAAQLARRPAYVPRVRIVTTHIKVQGAHPDQLQSGYAQRLDNVAAGMGQRLIGVYVRAGCIELVLDSADWGDAKSSDGGDIISETPMPDHRGRDSGPLPAPLQPRPPSQPAYWSAPNTPSRLQRRQRHQEALNVERLLHPLQEQQQQLLPQYGARDLQQDGVAYTQLQPSWLHAPQEPATVASPGSTSSAAWAGLALIPGLAMRRSGAAAGTGGQGYGHSGGSRSSVHGVGGSGAMAGGVGNNSHHSADLDLGAVIRALRLHRAEGSADSTNDLASEIDMDIEYGDPLDNIASGLSSCGSGLEASSKEASIGSGGRRGGGDSGVDGLSPAALGLTMASGGVATNTILLQQLQQHVIMHQQRQQDGSTVPAPMLTPPQPSAIGGMTASISRQALVLGGPRDPMAPGIVSLNPRVFTTAPVAIAGDRSDSGGGATVTRFTVIVRRVSTTPMAAVPAVAGDVSSGGTVGDLEFTMRARGDYLPLRAVLMMPVTTAVRVSLAPQVWVGSMSSAGGGMAMAGSMANVALGGGGTGVLAGMMERALGEGVQDTSSDIDTGYYGDGGRPVVAWTWHESYTLELLGPPQVPGLLLVDLRYGGADRPPPRAVPLVAVADAHVASELQGAAECWEGTMSELDDLLLDLGTWLHHVSQGLPAPGSMMTDGAMPAMTFPILDQRLGALGQHLFSYAAVCGWRATAALLQRDLARFGGVAPFSAPSNGSESLAFQSSSPQEAGAALWRASGVAAPAPPQHPELPNPALPAEVSSSETARRRTASWQVGTVFLPRQLWCGVRGAIGRYLSFCISVLWAPVEHEERESYKAFWQAYASQQIWLITLLDVASLAALLFRGRHSHLLSPTNIVTLIACCVGVLMATSRLVLPYKQWLHLAEVTKVPRHICYCITKGLIGMAGLPAPPGIVAYELGLPVFIFEAVIVPWSSLLSVPTSIVVSAVKAFFYVPLWHRLALTALGDAEIEALKAGCPAAAVGPAGAAPPCPHGPGLGLGNAQGAVPLGYLSLYRRAMRVLALSSLFVMVTAACNVHIRMAYKRHERKPMVRAAKAAMPGLVVASEEALGGCVSARWQGGAVAAVPLQRKTFKWE